MPGVGEAPISAASGFGRNLIFTIRDVSVDYNTLVKEYLEEVGIEKDGRPTKSVLKELKIEV